MQIVNMSQLINRVTPNSRKLTPRKSTTTLCVGVGWVGGVKHRQGITTTRCVTAQNSTVLTVQ